MAPPATLATTLRDLEQQEDDPQAMLTALVQLHGLLSSTSGPSLSLPGGSPSLSHTVEFLNRLLEHNTTQGEEEIVWFIARVAGLWGRGCSRFQLEAGRVRLWKSLQLARAAFPQSLRVLEASLDTTAVLLQCLEYHQQLITVGDTELVEEILELLGRFTRDSPDSTIVVLCMKTLASLYASPRVVGAFGDQYTRCIVLLLVPTLPHFLKTSDATCVWLALARQLVKLKPSLTCPPLFGAVDSSSWCQQLLSHWKHEPVVVYDLCALLTQLFLPVPHVLAAPVDPALASSLVHDHSLLGLLTDRLSDYFTKLGTHAKLPDRERRQMQATSMEIVRVLRQWSFVPEILSLFPSALATKKTLIPLMITQVGRCQIELSTSSKPSGGDAVQWRCRLLLELVLTLQQLTHCPALARCISVSLELRQAVSLLLKQRGYAVLPRERDDSVDAGDGDLAAVLERELKKTLALLSNATSAKPYTTGSPFSGSQRVLRRVPSSSSRTLSTSSSASASALTLRRTPSSSSQIRIS